MRHCACLILSGLHLWQTAPGSNTADGRCTDSACICVCLYVWRRGVWISVATVKWPIFAAIGLVYLSNTDVICHLIWSNYSIQSQFKICVTQRQQLCSLLEWYSDEWQGYSVPMEIWCPAQIGHFSTVQSKSGTGTKQEPIELTVIIVPNFPHAWVPVGSIIITTLKHLIWLIQYLVSH